MRTATLALAVLVAACPAAPKDPVPDTAAPSTRASPRGGALTAGVTVSLLCSDDASGCAGTFFTTDGSMPGAGSARFEEALAISSDTTLSFFSVDAAGNAEAVHSEHYTFTQGSLPAAGATPAGGSYRTAQQVTLSCTGGTPPCSLHFTTDGSEPTSSSPQYASPIDVGSTLSLRFFAVDAAHRASPLATERYLIDAAAPSVSAAPPPGVFGTSVAVVLACDDGSGAGCGDLRYTTDGSPSGPTSTRYTAPITVGSTTTLRWFATDLAGNASTEATGRWAVDTSPPTVTATPRGGAFDAGVSVSLACDDSDAGSGCGPIRYTVDGSDPDGSSAVYSAPLAIASTTVLKVLALDAAGLRTTGTESYVIDSTAPLTSVSPPGGSYTAALSVRLDCTDAQSGCAGTWFTVDGGAPGTASLAYTGPISIAASTALRWVSVDRAGNTEPAGAATYAVDAVAPSVVSTLPLNGAIDVVETATVRVTFSEPMNPATLDAQALFIPGVAGTVTWSAATSTATLTPSAPLAPDTAYVVVVTPRARDVAGNPLSQTVVLSFTTRTPAVVVSGPGSATLVRQDVAFNAAGDGVAVWMELTGSGCRFVASVYSAATGVWAPRTTLPTTGQPDCMNPNGTRPTLAVESNGTTFMVAWLEDQVIRAQRYVTGSWETPVTVATGAALSSNSEVLWLVSDGSGYALVWRETNILNGDVMGAIYSGTWGPAAAIESLTGTIDTPNVTGNSTGYLVAFSSFSNPGIWSTVYRAGAWSPLLQLATSGNGAFTASDGTNFCVAWAPSVGNLSARCGNGLTFGTVATVAMPNVNVAALASNGSTYLAAGRDNLGGITVATLTGTTWSATSRPVTAGVGSFSLVSAPGSYALAWDAAGTVWAIRNTGAWSAPATVPGSGLASGARLVRSPSGYHLSWAQVTSARHELLGASFTGTLGTPIGMSLGAPTEGSASEVRAARSSTGDVVAVWTQQHRGSTAVFAALRSFGQWRPPFVVAQGASGPSIVSNGSAFMIGWSQAGGYSASTFDGAVLGPAQVVGTGSCSGTLAAATSTYAAAMHCTGNGVVAVFQNGAWLAPVAFEAAPELLEGTPDIASNGLGYMVTWMQQSGGAYNGYASEGVAPAGSWTWSPRAVIVPASPLIVTPRVASNGSSYLAFSIDLTDLVATSYVAGGWSSLTTVFASSYQCAMPSVAVQGATYAFAGGCYSLEVRTFDGATWSAVRSLGVQSRATHLAAQGGGTFFIGYEENGSLNGVRLGATGFGTPAPIESSSALVPQMYSQEFTVLSEGASFAVVWPQNDAADSNVTRVYSRRGL